MYHSERSREYIMLHKYNPKSIWYLDRTRMQGNGVFDRLTSLYFRKRSQVETREGMVIYRRRVFRWFGFRQFSYIDYYFHSVDEIDDDIDQSYWVKGKISAIYLLADGQTVHHVKTIKYVSLPKNFTNMDTIIKALEMLRE